MKENKKINTNILTGDFLGINKKNFLVHFKAKWTLISPEDEQIYGIGNLFLENRKYINHHELETIYILTDNYLKIQNFNSVAYKILKLNDNINNSNISDCITELNLTNKYNRNNQKIKTIKRFSKSDFFKKYNNTEKNTTKIIHWKKKDYIIDYKNNMKSDFDSIKFSNKTKSKFINDKKILYPKRNSEININNINNINTNQLLENKNNINKGKIFSLKIKEAKFNDIKLGYIFILRSITNKNNSNENIPINSLSIQENEKNNISEISLISFGENKNSQNKNNFYDNSYSENIEKENQFTFNLNTMSYLQYKYKDKQEISLFEDLKEKAIKKLMNLQNNFIEEESDEEEEEESDYSNNSEDNNKSKKIISKEKSEDDNDLNINKQKSEQMKKNSLIRGETIKKNIKLFSAKDLLSNRGSLKNINENIIKNYLEDYYHINMSKISLYIYNYNSGFAELQKGHLISQVNYLLSKEKEKIKHSNSLFINNNNKFIKGKKKGNNKKDEITLNTSYNITSLKIKEIYKILSSNEK